MELILWIENWFAKYANGDWEKENCVKIFTLANPGWEVNINLYETGIEKISYNEESFKSDEDWYFVKVENAFFRAAGDIHKLNFLLSKFKTMVEEN